MRPLSSILLAATLAATAASPGYAQEPAQPEREARWTAHRGDFDYLLGDWEYAANSREFGQFTGRWSAVKLPEGQILDEWRVLGDGGETVYMTTTLRAYNSAADRWELIGMDVGGGLLDFGTGKKVGDQIHIEQKFGVAGGKPTIRRIRYYDITPDSFSWTSDLSPDDGKTWFEADMTIQARRIGPARTIESLAPLATP